MNNGSESSKLCKINKINIKLCTLISVSLHQSCKKKKRIWQYSLWLSYEFRIFTNILILQKKLGYRSVCDVKGNFPHFIGCKNVCSNTFCGRSVQRSGSASAVHLRFCLTCSQRGCAVAKAALRQENTLSCRERRKLRKHWCCNWIGEFEFSKLSLWHLGTTSRCE